MSTFALAVDLGGTKVEAALVDDSGAVAEGTRSRVATGSGTTPESLRSAISEVVAVALSGGHEIVGAGVGTAGPLEPGGVIRPFNLPAVHGFNLGDAVHDAIHAVSGNDVKTVVGHDGGCLALAESWLGAARDARASFSFVVSTGIGGGFVFDGHYIPGAIGNAGHIGQTRGRDGDILEGMASGPASVRWAREQGWQGETGEELSRSASRGDQIARAAIERSADLVGQALADVAVLLNLDLIAVGGGFSFVSDDYVELVAHSLQENAIFDYAKTVPVVRSELGGDGPLVGAAALVLR